MYRDLTCRPAEEILVFEPFVVYNNTMEKNQQRAIIMVVVITAFITTFTGSALNFSGTGYRSAVWSERRLGRLAHNGIYTFGSRFFGAAWEAGRHDVQENSSGRRYRRICYLLRRGCFFHIYGYAAGFKDSAGHRSVYDIQHQYGYPGGCLPRRSARTGPWIFVGIDVCGTFGGTCSRRTVES